MKMSHVCARNSDARSPPLQAVNRYSSSPMSSAIKHERRRERTATSTQVHSTSDTLESYQYHKLLPILSGNRTGHAADKSGTHKAVNLVTTMVRLNIPQSLSSRTCLGPLRSEFVEGLVERARAIYDEWKRVEDAMKFAKTQEEKIIERYAKDEN